MKTKDPAQLLRMTGQIKSNTQIPQTPIGKKRLQFIQNIIHCTEQQYISKYTI